MSFGDKEMIDIIVDVEKYMKEVIAGRATCKNCLLKVKLKTRDEFTAADIKEKKSLFAIQFTGEDENIAKIERFAKPIFKRFKFDIHKYGFYLDVETIHGTCPKYVTFPSYAISIDNWIIFEATDKQMELRVIYDKVFKEVFEVVL
jgi:hypothetical protein